MINKLIGEVKGIFNAITMMDICISLISILVGIIFYVNTNFSNTLVSVIAGCILIVNGVFSIYAYLKRGSIQLFNNNIIFGIILILMGILTIILRRFLSIVLGIYLLFVGIQKINYSVFLKKFNESSWLLTMVIGILLMIIAIITIFTKNDTLVQVAGIYLFGFGFINLISTILLRHRSKYFLA